MGNGKIMIKLLLVSNDKDSLSDLASALVKHDNVELSWAESGETALNLATDAAIDLIVTDERLGDMTGLEFAAKLLSVNPMINCASVSSLSHEKFHEISEGMGLMAQLPVKPDKEDAEKLLQRLKDIKNLMSGVKDYK